MTLQYYYFWGSSDEKFYYLDAFAGLISFSVSVIILSSFDLRLIQNEKLVKQP
jgi:hypothetical protein